MREYKSVKSLLMAQAIGNDHRMGGFGIDSYSSASLFAENRRIARRIVKYGSLAGNEHEFIYHAIEGVGTERNIDERFNRQVVVMPHFCNDCAYQGNHTPYQVGYDHNGRPKDTPKKRGKK